MAEKKNQRPNRTPENATTQIIGFRLPIPIAKAIKIEAARRQIRLNALLAEMWQLYREAKRAG
jgi:hypothetical protein